MNFREEEMALERQKEIMTTPRDPRLLFFCSRCAEDIYEGDYYFMYENECVCEDCFDDLQATEKMLARRIAGEDDE